MRPRRSFAHLDLWHYYAKKTVENMINSKCKPAPLADTTPNPTWSELYSNPLKLHWSPHCQYLDHCAGDADVTVLILPAPGSALISLPPLVALALVRPPPLQGDVARRDAKVKHTNKSADRILRAYACDPTEATFQHREGLPNA